LSWYIIIPCRHGERHVDTKSTLHYNVSNTKGDWGMTTVEYYRRVIWLPLLVPLLALLDLIPIFYCKSFSAVDGVALFLASILVFDGLPYLILLVLHWKLLKCATNEEWILFFVFAPLKLLLLSIPCAVLIAYLLYILNRAYEPVLIVNFVGITIVLCIAATATTIVLGYLYVLIGQAQLWLLRRIGWVMS